MGTIFARFYTYKFSLLSWGPNLPWSHFCLEAHVPITQANILFMGDLTFNFTLAMLKAFVFHAFHHLHEVLTSIQDDHPLVQDLSNLKFQSMKEGQFLGKLSIKRDDSQLCVEVLHIMGQWICFIPLGKLQELNPLL